MSEQDDVYRDGLLTMSDDEFCLVWELIVGEQPSILLERSAMVDALRSLVPMPTRERDPLHPRTAVPPPFHHDMDAAVDEAPRFA